jgi:hypothetical protein
VLTLEDLGRDGFQCVCARRAIADSPAAGRDSSAPAGATGEVCDVDHVNGVAFVDFGSGAIACLASELEAA